MIEDAGTHVLEEAVRHHSELLHGAKEVVPSVPDEKSTTAHCTRTLRCPDQTSKSRKEKEGEVFRLST